MSEEKIVSKTNLHTEANPRGGSAEIVKTSTDLMKSNSATINKNKMKIVNEENSKKFLTADESSGNVAQKSSAVLKVISTELLDHSTNHVNDIERVHEEASAEKNTFDSSLINEMNYVSEMDYNEYPEEEDSYYMKVKDIVDPNDPNIVQLQTDTHILQLSKLPIVPPFAPENSQDRLFDVGSYSSASTKSISYKGSSHSIKPETDFFENLGEVPKVSDISISEDTPVEVKKISKSIRGSGRFVNPLTGSVLSVDSDNENEAEIEELPSEEEQEAEEEQEPDEYSFEDYDAMHSENEKQFMPEQVQKEEEQKDLLDILVEQHQREGKIEFITEEQEKKKKEKLPVPFTDYVKKFLGDLLNRVVRFVENEESTGILRRNLNKKKLFHKIKNTIVDIYVEKQVNTFLERKAMEFYRRKRLLRYIIPERSDHRAQEYQKFNEACDRLDKLLGEEDHVSQKTSKKIEELETEKDEFEDDIAIEVERFENLVRNTLKREGMPRLEEFVEKEIAKIWKLGEEITVVRLGVINQQHVLATIKAKIGELEYIGGGLRIDDYESIERQAIAIEKKIEDRTRDLNKLHNRFNLSFHIMPHLKLRNELYTKRVARQNRRFNDLVSHQDFWRKVVFQLKTERQKIKRQISDLSCQNGLIDKPILLQDYDKTNELVERRRKVVEELRQNHKKLESKLKQLEKKGYS